MYVKSPDQYGYRGHILHIDDRPDAQERATDLGEMYLLLVYAGGGYYGGLWGLLLERTLNNRRGEYTRVGAFQPDTATGAMHWESVMEHYKTADLDATAYESRDADGIKSPTMSPPK
ncbi:hypothetical protein O1611_g9725 [Lasiodiplodia mahajangana]|uniref:Uncharacterized protein n=1 Tax=Lasiodiplodia mahajangana TaxID=1108764 RepID=A0ACC2J6U4_9PEZI|nr:hypothetical protein O1611_g9725 [Lasiodiplodia mahajangana]